MNRKRIGIVLIVVGALLAIGVGVFVYMQVEQATELARRTPTVDVVVAVTDLPDRVPIQAAQVALAKIPVDVVPPAAATRLADVVGKYPLTKIYKGETVIQAKVADASKATPAYTLKEGMVAATFAANDALSGTGAIRAGDKLDMLLTLSLPKPTTGGQAAPTGGQAAPAFPIVAQTALQNLEVLRVGVYPAAGTPDSGGGGSKSLTFQVSHQDALILKWLKDSGGIIDLVLRHPADNEAVTTEAITANYIFKKFRFVMAEPLQP